MSCRGDRVLVVCIRVTGCFESTAWSSIGEAREAVIALATPVCGPRCTGRHSIVFLDERGRWRVHSAEPPHSAAGGTSPGSGGGSTGQPRRRYSEEHRRKIREAALRRWEQARNCTSKRNSTGDNK